MNRSTGLLLIFTLIVQTAKTFILNISINIFRLGTS